jgi:hypothetical protein
VVSVTDPYGRIHEISHYINSAKCASRVAPYCQFTRSTVLRNMGGRLPLDTVLLHGRQWHSFIHFKGYLRV